MGAWIDRKTPGRTALRTLPFVIVLGFGIWRVAVQIGQGHPRGDATDLFTGNREVSVDSIAEPINSAAENSTEALDPNGLGPGMKTKPLPVWPPPPVVSAVDPAADGMQGAPPMHVDWPGPLPSGNANATSGAQKIPLPRSSASAAPKH